MASRLRSAERVTDEDGSDDSGPGDSSSVEQVHWIDALGAGAMAALGAGVFALSVVAMIVFNQIGGAITGMAGMRDAPDIAPEAAPPAVIASPALTDNDAWLANAQPFEAAPNTPLIAIIVMDDGTHSHMAQRAMGWDAPLSFAVAADFDNSPYRIEQFRKAGREVLAIVPFGYGDDLGRDPNVLRRGLTEGELRRRLRWHLARSGQGIVGIIDGHAGDIVQDPAALRIIGTDLAGRGMLMIDSRRHPEGMISARLRPMGVPVGRRTMRIARGDTVDEAFAAFMDAERHAFAWGTGIVLVEAGDTAMQALEDWLESRVDSIAIAPVSHVIRRLRTGMQQAAVQ